MWNGQGKVVSLTPKLHIKAKVNFAFSVDDKRKLEGDGLWIERGATRKMSARLEMDAALVRQNGKVILKTNPGSYQEQVQEARRLLGLEDTPYKPSEMIMGEKGHDLRAYYTLDGDMDLPVSVLKEPMPENFTNDPVNLRDNFPHVKLILDSKEMSNGTMKATIHGTSDLDARLEFIKAERERNEKIAKFDEERRQRYEREEAEKKEKLKQGLRNGAMPKKPVKARIPQKTTSAFATLTGHSPRVNGISRVTPSPSDKDPNWRKPTTPAPTGFSSFTASQSGFAFSYAPKSAHKMGNKKIKRDANNNVKSSNTRQAKINGSQ